MKALVRVLAAVLALVPALAAAQGTHSQSYAPTPTPKLILGGVALSFVPTPTPTHRAGAPGVAPSVANLPAHSPERLEFGEVWDGEKATRTFSVTSNGKGFLSAEIRNGPFHIVEYREMGLPIRSPNGQGVSTDVKKRIPYDPNDNRALGWETEPGLEIQIDVVFNPKFDLFSMTAGEKTSTFSIGGPGPLAAWQLGIPLHGTFHGLRISASMLVKTSEPVLVRPAQAVDVAVDLLSPAADAAGTIRGSKVPAGVSADPLPAAVGKAQTAHKSVHVRVPSGGGFPEDGVGRDVELTFDYGSGSSKAAFSLTAVPDHVTSQGFVPSCSIAQAWTSFTAYPDHLALMVQGENANLFEDKSARFFVTVKGKQIMWGVLHLTPGSVNKPTLGKNTYDTRRLPLDFDSSYTSSDFPSVVRGPVVFSCQLQ